MNLKKCDHPVTFLSSSISFDKYLGNIENKSVSEPIVFKKNEK